MKRPAVLLPATTLVAAVLSSAILGPARAGVTDYTVTEKGRGAFPTTAEARQISETNVSPDGRHIATLESTSAAGLAVRPGEARQRGSFVRRDGKIGTFWTEIRRGSIAWSADGRNMMYVARKDSTWRVVVDDEPGPPFVEISRVSFTGTDADVIYDAKRNDTTMVILNDRPYPACPAASWHWIDSPGGHVACLIPADGRWRLVVEDADPVEWDFVPYFGFTEPEGAHYFYIAYTGGKQQIVFDTTPRRTYDAVGKLLCHDDGTCTAWVRVGDKWHVARGDALGPGYDLGRIWHKELFLSPDGLHVAYVTGAAPGEPKGLTLHVDDRDFGPYDKLSTPVWSDDGTHWGVFGVRDGRHLVLMDGIARVPTDKLVGDRPFFSPDGAHSAYFVQDRNGETLMLDGEKALTMDKIIGPNLSFSPDGKHWALAGKRGDAWHLVLDGEAAANGYGDVRAPGPVFAKDGTISFIARKGDGIVCAMYAPEARGGQGERP